MTYLRFTRCAHVLWVSVIAATLAGASCLPAGAQDHQDRRRNNNFYQGAREGGRGGDYGHGGDQRDYNNRGYNHRGDNNQGYNNQGYNQGYNNPGYNQGGIGPGQGAAIGAVGGALLGAVFGGGLRGVIVGGAAGAGIGAIAGQAHQNKQRRQYYGGRPY